MTITSITDAGTNDLKDRILRAARQCFFEQGYFITSTREIAARAHTSESGIFRIFANKYDLLMAVYNDCWKEVNAEIDAHLPDTHPDPRQQLLRILETVWNLYAEKPLLMSFVIINTGNTDTLLVSRKDHAIISEENLRYIRRIEDLCLACVDQELVAKGLTARALREGLLGLSEGILLGWYLADKADHYPNRVTLDEAVALAATLLYGNPAAAHLGDEGFVSLDGDSTT